MIGIWGELTLVFLVPPSAPEHFGDTILFTTDDDILEAIFCSDETFDVDVESLCEVQCEEALRRPGTADGQGQERPYTQAGLWAEGRVGRAGAAESGRGHGCPWCCWCCCSDSARFSTSVLVPCVVFHALLIFVLFIYFLTKVKKAGRNPFWVLSVRWSWRSRGKFCFGSVLMSHSCL